MNEGKVQERKAKKRRMPHFIRQDAHKKKRLRICWRRPRGIDSKIRMNLCGYRRQVGVGWGSPSIVKGLSREGLMRILVENAAAVDKIDSKSEGIIIASGVGNRKRLMIIAAAKAKGIKILNIKDPDAVTQKIETQMKLRKSKKTAKVETKPESKSQKKSEPTKDQEDKKKKEKEEKNKLLTQRT